MSIEEAAYDNEEELDLWVRSNLESFLPGFSYLPPITIKTIAGKGGRTDGFAYNLSSREWYLVEAELLSHGVWPHIAEQITRFVVAMQNPQSRRLVRDHVFESIIGQNKVREASAALETSDERLLQRLELFFEANNPGVAIFIDDTSQDLYDMAQALSAQISIFRVDKFIVNGNVEYHSPDKNVPVLVTDQPIETGLSLTDFDVIEALGGGEINRGPGRFKFYQTAENSIIHIKRSKYHAPHDYYWYGITPSALSNCGEFGVTHIVFVMGEEGFVMVPIKTVTEFVEHTRTSDFEDGSVRHYHCLISPGPDPELYYSQEIPRFPLAEHYFAI